MVTLQNILGHGGIRMELDKKIQDELNAMTSIEEQLEYLNLKLRKLKSRRSF